MTAYVVRRVFYMMITLALVSVVGFAIIQLPPGDFLTTHLRQLGITGTQLSEEELQDIRAYYGLDRPGYMQYFVWVGNMLRGDLGESYSYRIPVGELLGDRLPLTVLVSLLTIVVTFLLAVPIGIYSATHQYSLGDYTATVFGFIGLATPNFMVALLLMWISLSWFGFPHYRPVLLRVPGSAVERGQVPGHAAAPAGRHSGSGHRRDRRPDSGDARLAAG